MRVDCTKEGRGDIEMERGGNYCVNGGGYKEESSRNKERKKE